MLIEGEMVVIRGFGEGLREASYRKRLLRVAVMLADLCTVNTVNRGSRCRCQDAGAGARGRNGSDHRDGVSGCSAHAVLSRAGQ